jgi:hypothetical protein
MPMELLQALADDELPVELFLTREVQDKLRILHDAGHIICSFPAAELAHLEPVRVHMVTPLGRKALRYFGPEQVRSKEDDGWSELLERSGA